MRRIAVDAIEPFTGGGRGPELQRWLHDRDLLFAGHHTGFAEPAGDIVGAQVNGGWVVLHGLQVLQVVPEEVHSYWHARVTVSGDEGSCAWRVAESPWPDRFNPRHLADCDHFVLVFYDQLVEALAEALIFGPGEFELEQAIALDGRLGYAHRRRAMSLSTEGRTREAEAAFEEYLTTRPDERARRYAERSLELLRTARTGRRKDA